MARNTNVLDVRTIPHGARHPQVFQKFDALASGEAFVLVTDHEPLGLLRELLATRPRAFEWNVLESGPETFRTEIERRTEATPRDVSEFLGRDHDRLDAILAEARKHAEAGACAQAREAFQEFVHGLIRHISMEENVLFPAFEQATGFRGGPVVVMQAEHREIGRLLEASTAAIAADDARRFLVLTSNLHSVLFGHNEKEEGILYPMTDQHVGGERERDELVRALQSQSASGGCGCCSHGTPKGEVETADAH